MNERHPEATEYDQATEEKITYIMDTRGYSRADAESAIAGWVAASASVVPVAYEESVRQHPATQARRPRARSSRPPVGEDSWDIPTGLISDEQARINARGIALVREILKTDTRELSGRELAVARARLEKKGRKS